jgi:hypothetical protein
MKEGTRKHDGASWGWLETAWVVLGKTELATIEVRVQID